MIKKILRLIGLASTLSLVACAGAEGPQGPAGAAGPAGPEGPTGASGLAVSSSPYGDGSAGQLIVTDAVSNWSTTVRPPSLQFTDFTIAPGAFVHIPSGTVIRCTGKFVNFGTINVLPQAAGGVINMWTMPDTSLNYPITTAETGISSYPPSEGMYGNFSTIQRGGQFGTGVSYGFAANILNYPLEGGGGGAAAPHAGFATLGGKGGGSFIVIAQGPIVNEGIIRANGDDGNNGGNGSGGGGGGIVILASKTSIQQKVTLQAKGGNGGWESIRSAAGGGGGGGIVHLLAPSISAGFVDVAGGNGRPAAAAATVTATIHSGGGGGGGSGGDGGMGGQVHTDGSTSMSYNGAAGHVIQTTGDPTPLF